MKLRQENDTRIVRKKSNNAKQTWRKEKKKENPSQTLSLFTFYYLVRAHHKKPTPSLFLSLTLNSLTIKTAFSSLLFPQKKISVPPSQVKKGKSQTLPTAVSSRCQPPSLPTQQKFYFRSSSFLSVRKPTPAPLTLFFPVLSFQPQGCQPKKNPSLSIFFSYLKSQNSKTNAPLPLFFTLETAAPLFKGCVSWLLNRHGRYEWNQCRVGVCRLEQAG